MDVARRQLIYVTRDPSETLCARFEERGWQIEIVASARDTRKALRGDLAMGGLLDLSGHFESHELAAFESSLTMTNVGWVAATVPGQLEDAAVRRLIRDYCFDYVTLPTSNDRVVDSVGHAYGMVALHDAAGEPVEELACAATGLDPAGLAVLARLLVDPDARGRGVGRALVRGQIDRLERDDQGRGVVIDYKTGRNAVKKEELAQHPQLGLYQLAVVEGGLARTDGADGDVEEPLVGSGGAFLLQLRSGSKATPQQQGPLEPDENGRTWVHELLDVLVQQVVAERFPARRNANCDRCEVRRACPAQPTGAQVV